MVADFSLRTDGRTDKHNEANSHILQFFEKPLKPGIYFKILNKRDRHTKTRTKSMANPEVQLFLSGKGSWRNVSGWLAMLLVRVFVCLSLIFIILKQLPGFRGFSKNCKMRLLASLCLSVRPSVRKEKSATTERIFVKFGFWAFFGSLWEKIV